MKAVRLLESMSVMRTLQTYWGCLAKLLSFWFYIAFSLLRSNLPNLAFFSKSLKNQCSSPVDPVSYFAGLNYSRREKRASRAEYEIDSQDRLV